MNFGDIYALVLKEYPDILTVDEMSKALGVSTKTGYQLLREKRLFLYGFELSRCCGKKKN